MTQVAVLALAGAQRTSVALTLDVLDCANRLAHPTAVTPPFSTTLFDGSRASERSFADLLAASGPDAVVVIVPGLGMTTAQEIETRLLQPDARGGARILQRATRDGAQVAGSCAGVFLLAEAGVLDQRRATTTWWLAPVFRRRYPDVILLPDQLVVTHHPVTTAGAAMAHLDLMLTLVGRTCGEGLARKCARYLAADRRDNQSPYVLLEELVVEDSEVAKAIAWAFDHLKEAMTVGDLADAVHVSSRTFARRVQAATGMSPNRLLRRVRVERAVALLQNSRLPVATVAREVGYTEASALRRAMADELGVSPSLVRRQV
jgi:transcriptional regulator GlxA family with amidase domain